MRRPGLPAPALLALAFLALLAPDLAAQEATQEATREELKPEQLLRQADALAAEDAGGAVALYREWLLANPEAEAFSEVLTRAVEAAAEVKEALSLLSEFGPRLRDPAAREASQERQAALLRLSGRLEEALVAQLALPETPARLVERAGLCLEMGLAGEAERMLLRARESGDPEAAVSARLLLGRVYLATGRADQGEQELRALLRQQPGAQAVPAALLALGEALRDRGEAAAAAETLAELQASFPASPEALIEAAPGVRHAAQPLRLLPPAPQSEPAQPGPAAPAQSPAVVPAGTAAASAPEPPARKALVQAGSFRDQENARYLVRDLVGRGFEARVVEKQVGEVRYYRVLVGAEQTPESAQALILRLKDAGYEGFLLLD